MRRVKLNTDSILKNRQHFKKSRWCYGLSELIRKIFYNIFYYIEFESSDELLCLNNDSEWRQAVYNNINIVKIWIIRRFHYISGSYKSIKMSTSTLNYQFKKKKSRNLGYFLDVKRAIALYFTFEEPRNYD